MTEPREIAIVKSIQAALQRVRRCVCRKRHVAMGVGGDPDLYGSIDGRHFEIEVKRPGCDPTPLQAKRLEDWRATGAMAGVARSVEDAYAVLGLASCQERKCTWAGPLEEAKRGYTADGTGDVEGSFFCPQCGAQL